MRGNGWYITPLEFRALADRRRELDSIGDLQNALLCSLIANGQRDTKKHPEPFTVDEFRVLACAPQPAKARSMDAHRANTMWQGFERAINVYQQHGIKVVELQPRRRHG